MGVITSAAYPLAGDELHAKILHSGIWLTGGTASASTTDSDYFEDGPQDGTTFDRWKPSSVPATWEDDHSGDVDADCFCIGAHTAGSAGATVTFEAYISSSWVEIGEVAPIDDMPIMLLLGQSVTFTKWRISVDVACEIGVAMAGEALTMPELIYDGSPLHLNRNTEYRANKSETGEFLGMTRQRKYLQTTYSWKYLTASWVRTNWRPFMIAMEENPFFIAWRPSTFSDVGLCWMNSPPVPAYMGGGDLMSVDLSVTGHAYD